MIKKVVLQLTASLIIFALAGFSFPEHVFFESTPTPEGHSATADELIYFTNLRRTQYGLSALTVNSILMTSAQNTANIMADNQIGSHLGGASQNISEMGYGNGLTVYSTENVANGTDLSAEYIVYTIWNDDLHNIPVMNPIYCDIGAGVATDAEGISYYVLRAAYNEKRYCGEYRAPDGTTLETLYAGTTTSGESQQTGEPGTTSQWMQPVSKVTPNSEGKILHEVGYGQTLWSIAITYGTTIKEIQALNEYAEDDKTVYAGQKLLIPTSLTPYVQETNITATVLPRTSTPGLLSTQQATKTIKPEIENTASFPPTEVKNRTFSTVLFWIATVGLLLILFGILMKFLPKFE